MFDELLSREAYNLHKKSMATKICLAFERKPGCCCKRDRTFVRKMSSSGVGVSLYHFVHEMLDTNHGFLRSLSCKYPRQRSEVSLRKRFRTSAYVVVPTRKKLSPVDRATWAVRLARAAVGRNPISSADWRERYVLVTSFTAGKIGHVRVLRDASPGKSSLEICSSSLMV